MVVRSGTCGRAKVADDDTAAHGAVVADGTHGSRKRGKTSAQASFQLRSAASPLKSTTGTCEHGTQRDSAARVTHWPV